MPGGRSVHIGLNTVDSRHYRDGDGKPWDGKLEACENDARSMAELATQLGFDVQAPLLTTAAQAAAVASSIGTAATELSPGDMFLLTYSGHGGQVSSTNHDDDPEEDNLDETWCLYDRQLLDDELFVLFSEFRPGVRIVVLSDSCHSGTVTRADPPEADSIPPAKQMPKRVAEVTEIVNASLYDAIQRGVPPKRLASLAATVVLLSGCQDSEFSRDGPVNGAFTDALLGAWSDPRARRSMRHLQCAIADLIPDEYNQHPNLAIFSFDVAPPLKI